MAPRLTGHGYSLGAVLKCGLLPVLVAGMTIASSFPFPEWFPSPEANAAMLADPPPAIDGKRAFGYLKQICEIGPHTAGSEANSRVRRLIADHFTKLGGKVREQPFRAVHPATGEALVMTNLVASWKPDRLQRVVIGAHYDTRPHPDQEILPERLNLPFVGANDPGSGIAVLMEIAHHLSDVNTQWGVDLVLFDGEELVFGDDRAWGSISWAPRSSHASTPISSAAGDPECGTRPGSCSTWSAAATCASGKSPRALTTHRSSCARSGEPPRSWASSRS